MDKDKAISKILLEWHKTNRRRFPWREERNPYVVLVAEFFLQRTPADRVAEMLRDFLKEYPSLVELAHADIPYLKTTYGHLGLVKRMEWLVQSAEEICQKHDGRIPDNLEELTALPGIGGYTAAAILSFGFGRNVPIIDSNVVRVLTRLYGLQKAPRTGNEAIRNATLRLLAYNCPASFNEAILDFAAILCKKRPLCEECPISTYCDYHRNVS